MQHLLARAKWDADGARDDTRGCVIEHLGDPGAVLAIDETGDIKKGTATPGVQRQYTGTAGRIENAQVAVYLAYAAPRGHALIDRELYLPRSWTGDQGRCAAAGIPAGTKFATKPQLAQRMIERTAAAAVPFAWVAGDEVYGGNGPLRAWLETRRIAYVLAVACDHRVPAGAGPTWSPTARPSPGARRATRSSSAPPSGTSATKAGSARRPSGCRTSCSRRCGRLRNSSAYGLTTTAGTARSNQLPPAAPHRSYLNFWTCNE